MSEMYTFGQIEIKLSLQKGSLKEYFMNAHTQIACR